MIADGRELTLEEPGTFVVGRGIEADVRVDDARVSRRHAVLRPADVGWVLEDESAGGTFVGDRRVERLRIVDRMLVRPADRRDGPLLELELVARDGTLATSLGVGKVIAGWRTEAWQNARRLAAAPAGAARERVAARIRAAAAERAQVIQALASNRLLGSDPGRRDAFCLARR